MVRYIYTWHEDTWMYSIRVATEEEKNRIDEALKLFEHCKRLHDSIIHDADSLYNGDIDRFIDDEAYYIVQNLHKDLDRVNDMTKGLIELATGKYYFFFW